MYNMDKGLHIKNCKPSDSGLYMCLSGNYTRIAKVWIQRNICAIRCELVDRMLVLILFTLISIFMALMLHIRVMRANRMDIIKTKLL